MSRLGPDVAEDVRRRLFAVLRESVKSTRGEEVKGLGDGLIVAFRASVGDAVACAIAMQRGISRLNLELVSLPQAIRVGLAVGEARLCAKATPGQILASSLIACLADEPSRFTSLGVFELKGIRVPVETVEVAWETEPGTGVVPLPAALDVGEGTAFVGREAALGTLRAMIERAADGLALVVGEPGTGKTRVARELGRTAHASGTSVLYGRCSTAHASPWDPFVEALRWYVATVSPETLSEDLVITPPTWRPSCPRSGPILPERGGY